MSPAAAIEAYGIAACPLWPSAEPAPHPSPEPAGQPSLDAAFTSAWSALQAGLTAMCFLCGGTLHPRWSAGAGVVGGRCRHCGMQVD